MPERSKKRANDETTGTEEAAEQQELVGPEPDPGVCENRRSGKFGYRPEDWPNR